MTTSTTAPVTLNPAIIGQAEKHHTAILARALSGTTVDEKQWITLNQALAAGGPVESAAHVARVSQLTQWPPADVQTALTALDRSGLVQVSGEQVEVTEAGRTLATKVRAESGQILTAAYGTVSAEDLATTARVLTTITTKIAEELSHP